MPVRLTWETENPPSSTIMGHKGEAAEKSENPTPGQVPEVLSSFGVISPQSILWAKC